jgi:SAM-dependent methyltransferase
VFLRVAKKLTRGRIFPPILQSVGAGACERILLIGSGPGFADRLDQAGYEFDACDIDRHRDPDFLWDITTPYPGQKTYQLILCVEVLEHVTDPSRAVAHMLDALDSSDVDGRLIISTPFAFETHDAVDCGRLLPDFIQQFDGARMNIDVHKVHYNFILVLLLRAMARKSRWQKLLALAFLPVWLPAALLVYQLVDGERIWGHTVFQLTKKAKKPAVSAKTGG